MKNFKHKLFDEVLYFENPDSTTRKANELIKSKEAHGNFLVIAREQSAGIGRKKNFWFSPKDGIWMTAALYGLSVESNLTIFTGICIHKSLSKLFPEIEGNLKLKWPNDIFLNNKKLCGILSSHLSANKYHLLGIGINTSIDEFPQELTDIATSLKKELNSEINNLTILNTLFDIFAEDLPDFIEGNIDIKYFKRNSFLLNKTVELDTDFDKFSGISHGINKQGALLLELKEGMIQPFYAGTVVSWT
ncbi:MAG: biotin--[acetyl-CoA-carboxylase] ligase [Candidatus Cloacimonetes bacterium]|nr:biotin--[acetyl-CoA-carboxylase] ligase [Candidatus Cloacimonadota bacterium]